MKNTFLRLCKYAGLFAISRKLTERRPRILCYHGISVDDEWRFRPGLYMRPEVFRERMNVLQRSGFDVVGLDQIAEQHEVGRFSKDQLAITVDDGWAGIVSGMFPAIYEQGFTATLYLSTYYVKAQRPVFNVAVDYLFWKYGAHYAVTPSSCLYSYASDEKLTAEGISKIVADVGSGLESPVLRELCEHFGESYDGWLDRGKLTFVSEDDVRRLCEQGVQIELHTHRHKFSGLNEREAEREIRDNLEAISRICDRRATHFCFPSGEYHRDQARVLRAAGVRSATTTRNELVSLADSLLELPRIMDSEHVSALEFEAELSGFLCLLRQIRGRRSRAYNAAFSSAVR